ncbi:hypothetical protein H0H92_011755 [Tricholoma furcatifolium]|nr:hypothetical protein H0H92_011755 [Tricholoma furcatifolium]
MPVTFPVANHPSKAYEATGYKLTSDAEVVLKRIESTHEPAHVLQSSLNKGQNLLITKSGFVDGVVEAYNKHYNLIIRPDDVWIAILSQLNF